MNLGHASRRMMMRRRRMAKMNKQTEDKILEMLLHIHEKSLNQMVFNGGLSVAADLGR